MSNRGKKRPVICISDSDSESESESEQDEDDEEQDLNSSSATASDDDDDDVDGEWSCEEEEETDQESISDQEDGDSIQKSVVPLDEGAQYDKVVHLLKGGGDLQSLRLEECKVYLRKHGLRVTGTKAVCIQRIQEHWRIKDGAEKLYPRSSFTINCTGDVCKGDVVLFKQRVYNRFDKMTRCGSVLGKRTIVGRVVKESYGAAKQQHTFTVEVLWSKGIKKLPPLFPLLVKGRNLYRMRTFRQRWENEAERSRVLAEKHKRGAAARHIRAMKKAGTANGAAKRQKRSHDMRPPNRCKNQESQPATKASRKHAASYETKRVSKADKKRASKPKATEPSFRNFQTANSLEVGVTNPYVGSGPQNHYVSHRQLYPGEVSWTPNRAAFSFSNHHTGSTSSMTRMPTSSHYPPMINNQPHYGYAAPGYQFDPRTLNHPPHQGYTHRRHNTMPLQPEIYRGVNTGLLRCSAPGCQDRQDEQCVTFSCFRCCRRSGRRCHWHQPHYPF